MGLQSENAVPTKIVLKKIPLNLHDEFLVFLAVIGYKSKSNPDRSMTCINPKMPKERRQITMWADGKMNKSCQLLWFDFLNHWLIFGKEFLEKMRNACENDTRKN